MDVTVAIGLGVAVWHRHYSYSAMRRAEGELALMLRNQLAMDLLDHPDEHVIDDEPVLLSGCISAPPRPRPSGLAGLFASASNPPSVSTDAPTPGWIAVTNKRFVYASVNDHRPIAVTIADVKLTHVEDGWVTFAWRDAEANRRALTIGFKPKTKLLREVVSHIPGETVFDDVGAATPSRARLPARVQRRVRLVRGLVGRSRAEPEEPQSTSES